MKFWVVICFAFLVNCFSLNVTTFDEEKGMGAGSGSFNLDNTASYVPGLDFSTLVSTSSASCFVSSGYKFTSTRGYRSNGVVDSNMCTSVKNLKAAGMIVNDIYMFPCPTCTKSATTQINELISAMKSCNITSKIWLDIEGSQYWTTSFPSNKIFYQDLVDTCTTAYAKNCGVYSSLYQWQSIFGSSSYVYGNQYALWYAHYDNNPTFSDFTPFGGWTTPYIKQYLGTTTVCSMGVDLNVVYI